MNFRAILNGISVAADGMTEAPETRFDHQILTGMFRHGDCVQRAYNSVCDRGYIRDEINLLMSDDTLKKYYSHDALPTEDTGIIQTDVAEVGCALGGSVTVISGIITLLQTCVLIPDLGILVAGPIAVNMAHADAKSMRGGTKEALLNLGIREPHAIRYECGIKSGNILLGVSLHNEADAVHFEKNWNANGVEEIFR